MTIISEKEAQELARPFGEAVGMLVVLLGTKLSSDPMDEIERQLDVLIDGAPLMVSELDIPRIRVLARETAGNIFIASLNATPAERMFCVEMHDHVDRITKIVTGERKRAA